MRRLAAILAVTGTACTSMRVQSAPATSVLNESSKQHVKVKLAGGERVELYDARLVGDSLVGYTRPRRDAARQQVSVATAEVRELAVEKFSAARTVVAVGVIVAAVAIIAGGSGSSQTQQSSSTGCESSTAAVPPAT